MTDLEGGGPIVELVDPAGRPIGSLAKLQAHRPPGRLHRAFSVLLLDGTGRLLLQRRSAVKYHSPGLWSNTCCGHPPPGVDPALAASRRLAAELGLEVAPGELKAAGTVTYELRDVITGLVEREFNHLYVGTSDAAPAPDGAEVAEVAARPLEDLAGDAEGRPGFTAWFPIVLRATLPALLDLRAGTDLPRG